MPDDSVVDLTARLNALREVLQGEIRASHDAASARMDAIDASRSQYVAGLEEKHAGLEDSISALRTLQETLHAAMEIQTQLRAEALARETLALKEAVQLQMDQRFSDAAHQVQLIQKEIDRRMAALKDLMDERHTSQLRSFEEQRDSAMNAVQAALASAREAVNKAEAANEKRFAAVNEFRQTLSDQASTFPTRQEVTAQLAAINAVTDRNSTALKDIELRFTSRLDTMAGRDSGAELHTQQVHAERTEQRLSQGAIVSLVIMIVGVIGLIVTLITVFHH